MASDVANGYLITFEGGEGAGKSTQVKRLASTLENLDHKVLVTREPGGSPGAEDIRTLMVTGEADRWDAMTELLLATAARRDHVENTIKPALAQGKTVLCDRFIHSTLAYQGGRGGVTEDFIQALHKDTIGGLWPMKTFVFDIDPSIAMERTRLRDGDKTGRFEKMGPSFHERLRARFLDIAANDPCCTVIDAAMSEDSVSEAVKSAALALLEKG